MQKGYPVRSCSDIVLARHLLDNFCFSCNHFCARDLSFSCLRFFLFVYSTFMKTKNLRHYCELWTGNKRTLSYLYSILARGSIVQRVHLFRVVRGANYAISAHGWLLAQTVIYTQHVHCRSLPLVLYPTFFHCMFVSLPIILSHSVALLFI